MDIIVLDLEWNQDSADKRYRNTGKPIFEIIEIGAVKINQNYDITDRFSRLIKPQIYKTMHEVTANLIHMEIEDLNEGTSFNKAVEDFLSWCGEEIIFATWGVLDLLELQRNMKYYEMTPLSTGPIKYYDVQKLFSIEILKDKSRKTLEYAIDYFKLNKDEPFHRALSDAYYTALVLKKIVNEELLKYVSYDTYCLPQTKKDEIKVVFPGYMKHISRAFETKSHLMKDKEVSSTKCFLCCKNLKKTLKWFSPNGKHYYSVSYCDVHGYIKYKVRIRKNEDKMYYAVKTAKFTTEEKVKKLAEGKSSNSPAREKSLDD